MNQLPPEIPTVWLSSCHVHPSCEVIVVRVAHSSSAEFSSVPALPRAGQSRSARPWDPSLETKELLLEAQSRTGEERTAILNQVVERHLGLADALANRYWHSGQDREDLVQVARAGLVEAARRFDPALGDFIAFAVPTITGVIKRHFRDHGWMVRPPRQTQELVISVRQNWSATAQEVKGEPSSADLAKRAGVPAANIREAMMASDGYRPASLTHSECVLPSTSAQEEFERCEAHTIVLATLRQLTTEEQRLVRMRYFERLSQQEIAVRIGTNQMSVSRQLTRLLAKMRGIVGSLEVA